jgi:DNA-binding helix-hairpin-helix protein with protein kinase domain
MDLADYGLEALHPGKRLRTRAGRSVTVGAPLGAGNEGLVLRGEMDGKAVAVKVLRPDRTGTRLERTRALVAKQLASSVDAHIAGPFDQLDFNGRAGHISWLVPGTDVAALPDLPMLLNSRQRVMATIRLGVLLAKIHRAGMAFGDLNKGAVRVLPAGEQDAEVYLVDLDSAVLRGVPLPPTLGAPDTAAPELRRGEQPRSVAGWRAADWTAYGHLAIELLLAKTAGCGIYDPEDQVNAFMDVPPFLGSDVQSQRIDRSAGLPSVVLPGEIRRLLARLFSRDPAVRDGAAFVKALSAEVMNNHQIQCKACGAAYFVHQDLPTCPGCRKVPCPALQVVLPDGSRRPVSSGLHLTRELMGNQPHVSRSHARLFRLGAVTFVTALATNSHTLLLRGGVRMELPLGIHVPVMPGDRLRLGAASATELLIAVA